MKTELKNIGSWGRLHYDFLYRNNRTDINVMRLNRTLNNYLADMVRNACEMFDSLVRQTAENEGVTEQFKSTNQIEWIRRMNNIQSRVRELILNELNLSIVTKRRGIHPRLLLYALFSYSFHIPLSKRQTPPVPLWKGKIREYPAALCEQ